MYRAAGRQEGEGVVVKVEASSWRAMTDRRMLCLLVVLGTGTMAESPGLSSDV